MEQDVMLSGIQMRRPDLAYFSGPQIDTSITSDVEPIPEFLIEVISQHDDAEKVEEKLAEYFDAAVKVVWHVYPEMKLYMFIHQEKK